MKYVVFAGHVGSSVKNIIIPLLDFFKSKNVRVIFLHANSLTGNINIQQVDGLETFDVFLNSYDNLKSLLLEKKPIAIYCLSFRSLFDIFINRLAHECNIPSVYFEHGLFIPGLGDKFVVADYKSSIKRYYRYIQKYFVFLAAEKLNILKEIKHIYNCIKLNDYSNNKYNYYLFYAVHGKEQLYPKFKFSDDELFYSGYPLVKYKSDLTTQNIAPDTANNYCLYIHQPLIQDGLTSFTYQDETLLISQIVTALKKNNLQLIFKIHPREDINAYRERFKDIDVLISAGSFTDILPGCKLIIGQFSTALFFAAKFFLPLYIIPYTGVDESYYTIFETIGKKVDNVNDLTMLTSNIGTLPEDVYNKYLHFNKFIIGNNNSFEEQAEQIIYIAEKDIRP